MVGMQRWILIGVTALGSGLCGTYAQAQTCEPAKAAVKYAGLSRPIVKVTASPTVPPFTFSDPTTMKLTGLETEIIEYILNCAGVKFEYMIGNWNGGLASLFNGAADIMIGNVNYTAERASKADFVVFMRNGTSVMVDKGNPKNIRGVDGLCGVTGAVGMTSSSRRVTEELSRACTQKGQPPINIQLSDGTDPAYRMLTNRRIDFVMDSAATVGARQASSPELYDAAFTLTTDNMSGPVVAKGNSVLAQLILDGLMAMKNSGELEKVMKRYGLPEELMAPIEIRH